VDNFEKSDKIAFGPYEVDLKSGEILKSGYRVRLQDQPFRVLAVLLSRPGQLVTHGDLHERVWGPDTNVDFERAIAVAIKKIREALSDSAEHPKYVETMPKRGYRFIAPVTLVPAAVNASQQDSEPDDSKDQSPAPASSDGNVATSALLPATATSLQYSEISAAQASPLGGNAVRQKQGWNRRETVLASVTVLLLGLVAVLWLQAHSASLPPLRVEQFTHDSPISAGPPSMENLLTLATDGQRVFTSVTIAGKPQLAAIDISTGGVQPLTIPTQLASAKVAAISADGSHLLLRSQLSFQSEQPLWIVPTAGGGALRVGNIMAQDATWMPDGASILFASGNELNQIRMDGGIVTPVAELKGRAFWLRWSPDGTLLRFTLMDPLTHTGSLWELKRGSTTATPLLKKGISQSMDCCGDWTADGKAYVFQASENSSSNHASSNLWELKGSGARATLIQLTNGPLRYFSPITPRSGHRIYFYGSDQPSGLQIFTGKQLGFRPERTFLADANRISYSKDRKWVAWTDFSAKLWRARAADGSERIQLTSNDFEVFSAQWSPDGGKLAMMARRSGERWQIYVVSMDGGKPELLIKDNRNVADPSWSADGNEIVFGREPDSMGKENGSRAIEIFNLKSNVKTTLPKSEGLFSPRWSPDGKWIAALTLAQNKVMLFDIANQRWSELALTSAADPTWSNDSKSIFVHAFLAENQPILRISVPGGQSNVVAGSADFHSGEPADYFFGGLTPEGLPLVRPRVGTGNLFTLDLDQRK
jgi:DNA-binding winged helix-turn-helix (wHTH) protein/Tol biopolymer transport system component